VFIIRILTVTSGHYNSYQQKSLDESHSEYIPWKWILKACYSTQWNRFSNSPIIVIKRVRCRASTPKVSSRSTRAVSVVILIIAGRGTKMAERKERSLVHCAVGGKTNAFLVIFLRSSYPSSAAHFSRHFLFRSFHIFIPLASLKCPPPPVFRNGRTLLRWSFRGASYFRPNGLSLAFARSYRESMQIKRAWRAIVPSQKPRTSDGRSEPRLRFK